MRYVALAFATVVFFTGCGTPEPTKIEREEREAKEQKEQKEQAIRQVQAERWMRSLENARFIRERCYCAGSPESLANLYEFLKAGDSERAAAVADLTDALLLESKTRILVLKARPFYKGIGANLVRVTGTGRACFVANRGLVD